MKQVLKYGVPVVVVLGMILAMLTFKGVINSEIPVDYHPDPSPLHQKTCPDPDASQTPPG